MLASHEQHRVRMHHRRRQRADSHMIVRNGGIKRDRSRTVDRMIHIFAAKVFAYAQGLGKEDFACEIRHMLSAGGR